MIKMFYSLSVLLAFNSCLSQEDFYTFVIKFSFDKNFQQDRVLFPLKKYVLDEKLEPKTIVLKDRNMWKNIQLIQGNSTYLTDISDSFKTKLNQESNERIFSFIGIENGINTKYYFKRIDKKWFLVWVEDFST